MYLPAYRVLRRAKSMDSRLILALVGASMWLTTAASAQPWRYLDARGNVHYTSSPAELPPEKRARILKALKAKRDAAEAAAASGETPAKPVKLDRRQRAAATRRAPVFGAEEAMARRNKAKVKGNAPANVALRQAQIKKLKAAIAAAQAQSRALQRQMKGTLTRRDIARRDAAAVPAMSKINARKAAEAAVKALIEKIAEAKAAERKALAALRAFGA